MLSFRNFIYGSGEEIKMRLRFSIEDAFFH